MHTVPMKPIHNEVTEYAERLLREAASTLAVPNHRECLACYVSRQLGEFGCDTTLRFTERFRDLRAPAATGLADRLGRRGGFCDCEIFWNVYEECDADDPANYRESDGSFIIEPCRGVRRGSTQPCTIWRSKRRE